MRLAGLEVSYRIGPHFHVAGGSAAKRLGEQGINRLARARPTWGPMIVMVAQKPERSA